MTNPLWPDERIQLAITNNGKRPRGFVPPWEATGIMFEMRAAYEAELERLRNDNVSLRVQLWQTLFEPETADLDADGDGDWITDNLMLSGAME